MPQITIDGKAIPLQEYIDAQPKKEQELIVLGSAPSALNQLYEAKELFPNSHIMAVNYAGVGCPYHVHYVASVHGDQWLLEEINVREAELHILENYLGPQPLVTKKWRTEPNCGTSGLFGAAVGLCMGYEKLVFTGVEITEPLYRTKNSFFCWSKIWGPMLKKYSRGFSGLPLELFGHPKEGF